MKVDEMRKMCGNRLAMIAAGMCLMGLLSIPVMAQEGQGAPPLIAEENLVSYPLSAPVARVRDSEVRSAPGFDAPVVGAAYSNSVYHLIGDGGNGWTRIAYNGAEAYIPSESLTEMVQSLRLQPGMEDRMRVVDYAMGHLGGRYRFGGSDPSAGFDCSGFTQYVFQNAVGLHLPRSAKAQMNLGQAVDIGQIRPGDMIFFGSDASSVNHVGIYVGDGKIIQAEGTGIGITVAIWNGRTDCYRVVNLFGD